MDQNAPKSNRSAFKRVRQNLYRNQATGIYYAWVKRDRKKFKRSLKTTDRELAGRRLRDFIADADRLTSADAKELDFETVANRWLESVRHTVKESTHLRRKQSIAAFLPAFRLLSLRRIKQSDCEQWAAQRSQAVAAQTFAHELETLRAIFNYAAERGLILRSPALGIKRMRIVARRPNVPSRADFARLVETIRHADGQPGNQARNRDGADLVELLAYAGLRLDEARNVRWRDVHLDAKPAPFLTVTGGERQTKNYQVREVPICKPLFGLLSRLFAGRAPEPQAFIVKIQSAKKCLETACRKMGLARVTHHTLRHYFATTCIEDGVDIPTVRRWLGHKDGGALAMKTYGHLRQEHSFAQIERVHFAPSTAAPGDSPTPLKVAAAEDAALKETAVSREAERLVELMRKIPVIERLPDDPEWEKVEQAFARHASSKLPPPEE